MSIVFCDSSALVKRYLTETGSAWITSLLNPAAGNTIVIAAVTRVEVAAAFAARHRASNGITQEKRDDLYKLLVLHCTHEYRTLSLNADIVDRAMALTRQHR